MKKAIFVLLGPALVLGLLAARPTEPKAGRQRPVATATAPLVATAPNRGPMPGGAKTAAPAAAPSPSAAPASGAASAASVAIASPKPSSPKDAKGASLSAERRALDAVASGDSSAPAQYEALAREHPENPAFAEAARILRTRRD